jgi:hypothetical protein
MSTRKLYGSLKGVLRCLGMPEDTARLPAAFDTVGGIDGIDEFRASHSAWVDTKCSSNAVPFEDPVDEQVDRIVNIRTACEMVASCGVAGYDLLLAREDNAILDFLSFAKGVPVRTGGARTNLAVVGSSSSSSVVRTIP